MIQPYSEYSESVDHKIPLPAGNRHKSGDHADDFRMIFQIGPDFFQTGAW
jgi:hypothetical protein